MVCTILAATLWGCTKETFVLNDQTSVPGLDPSFAIPLVNSTLNLGDIEEALDDDGFIYSEANETFALIYRADLLDFSARELSGLGNENFSADHALTDTEATILSSTPSGNSVSFFDTQTVTIAASNGEEITDLTFGIDTLDITLNSEIAHDHSITITIPDLTLDGNPFSATVDMPYPGSSPFSTTESVIITGYTLDLTQGGTTFNTFDVETELGFTATGNSASAGESVDIDLSFDLGAFAVVHGYFGQPESLENVGTQNVNVFEDLEGGVLHFEEPRVDLFFYNSAGITAQAQFTSVFAPENSVEQELTGTDLTNIPEITRAAAEGDDELTTHVITNDGVAPQLNTLLDEGPFTLLYTGGAEINPNGYDNNFLLDTSRLLCRAEIVLPFYGYANNFTQADTLNLDLADALGTDEDDVLTVEDIERATIRLIADNGLPIEVGTQVYFADSLHNVLDSLFAPGPFENILDQGYIDFSLPESDPNSGKVLSATRKITDMTMTGEQLRYLIDNESTKVIVKSFGHTNLAPGQMVKFFPEYNIGIKLSAKVDFDINFQE